MRRFYGVRDKGLSERLRHERENAGMSIASVASKIGVSGMLVCKIENCKCGITEKNAIQYCKAVGADPEKMLDGIKFPSPSSHMPPKSPQHSELGKRLRHARHAAGFSQTELAKVIGISKTLVSRYENGTAPIDMSRLKVVCEAVEADPDMMAHGCERALAVAGNKGQKPGIFDQTLSERMVKAREASGLSVGDVAKAMGINKLLVSSYEKHKIPVPFFRIKDYCFIVGTDYKKIIEGIDAPPRWQSPLSDAHEQLGVRFRLARIKAGIDQVSVAITAYVSESTISALERGVYPVHKDVFMRICDAIKVDPSEIAQGLENVILED